MLGKSETYSRAIGRGRKLPGTAENKSPVKIENQSNIFPSGDSLNNSSEKIKI